MGMCSVEVRRGSQGITHTMRAEDPDRILRPHHFSVRSRGRLGRGTAPAFAQPPSRVGAHDADDEVDDQPDDRDANREAEKEERETDQPLENAEHEAEEEKPQHGQRADREYGAKHRCELQAVAVSTTREARAVFQPDVVVVGAGLIGLTCATAIAREGLRVRVISSNEHGTASGASAGILGPRVGRAPPLVRTLGIAARDIYPGYVEDLWSRTDVRVSLDSSGILEVALDDASAEVIRSSLEEGSEWVDGTALADAEPSLARAVGAAFH